MAQLESLLTLRQLRYFVSVVEHHGFSAAARALHVAQPSLSRQIAQVETALDERLLVRHADGVATTDAGQRLYGLARTILDRVNGAQAEVRGEERTPTGQVSVALPAMGGMDMVAEVVQVCQAELPLVDLTVIDGMSAQNSQLLSSGLVDFGVVPDAEQIPGLSFEHLFIENIYLVRAQAEGLAAAPPEISLADAFALPLVLGPRNSHLRMYLEHMAATQGVALNVVHEQQSMGVITAFVRAGLGATLANWPSLSDYMTPQFVLVQRIVDPPLGRRISIGYPVNRPLNHAAMATYRIVKRLLLARLSGGRWRGEPL